MPMISQLPTAPAINGTEIIPATQGTSTFKITASQLAAFSLNNFGGLTGEVTSSLGSFVTTINKSITPTWLGKHGFGAGILVSLGNIPPAPNNPNVVAQFMGIPSTNSSAIQIDGFGNTATVYVRRANGTPAAPSAVKSGDILGGLNTPSFDGSIWSPGVRFQGIATADWTPSSHSSAAFISAASATNAAANPVAYFYGSGGVSIGSPFPDPGASNLAVSSGLAVGNPSGGSIPGGVNAKAYYIDGTLFTGSGSTPAPRRQRLVTASPIVVQTNDDIINCNIPVTATCTLPIASTRGGVPLTFKDLGQAFAHNITLTASGTDAIEGQPSIRIGNNYQSITLVPLNDGTSTGWSVA